MTDGLHSVLTRQLRRLGLRQAGPPADVSVWAALVERVHQTYVQADQDRYTLERSLDISSVEMQALYRDLQRSTATVLAAQEDQLGRTVDALRATCEASLDAILLVNEQRRVLVHNQRFVELWRCHSGLLESRDEAAINQHIAGQVLAPAEFLGRVAELQQCPGKHLRDEVHLRDGRIVERYAAPLLAPTPGVSHGWVWFFRDVTARRRADEELREANSFLSSIIDHIPDLVWVKHALSLRFARANPACREFFGLNREQLAVRSDFELLSPVAARLANQRDREALRLRGPLTCDDEHVQPRGGETRIFQVTRVPILNSDGEPVYLLGLAHDVTELRRTETALRAAKEAAEAAEQAKSSFFMNMSHELRTPLNAIIGFGGLLRRDRHGTLSAAQREYVDHVVTAGEHMLELVNDLLNLRRLEQSPGPATTTTEAVPPVIHEAVALVRPLLDARQLELELHTPELLPEVLVERRGLLQVLINLLSNAAKFTPPGGRITVSAALDEGAADTLRITVADTGVGIAAADLPRLFTYFTQVGAKYETGMKGSGIGLALTRALLASMGGSIRVDSTPGLGSSFECTLRCAPVVAQAKECA